MSEQAIDLVIHQSILYTFYFIGNLRKSLGKSGNDDDGKANISFMGVLGFEMGRLG
jgi:hypothetical protein